MTPGHDTAVQKVQGKRSPRWALWSRMTIPCYDGTHYLVRLRIVQTPWFSVLLHDIHNEDRQDPHNHPWSFISLVLRGRYTERVYPDPVNHRDKYTLKTHGPLSVHVMLRSAAHRITDVTPGLKTLILTGPRKDSWGFFREYADHRYYQGRDDLPVKGRFIDWKDYEAETRVAT